MKINRMELADIGNPIELAKAVIKQLPDIKPPIPIHEIARALGILEIKPIETSGFEGGLIADESKNHGYILFNEKSNPVRQRYTVGHETGHFLNPWHTAEQGKFMCQAKGMIANAHDKNDKYQKLEVEANRFASEILMPSNYMRQDMSRLKGVEIDHIVSLATKYQVSREAMGRRYVDFQDEPCALLFSRNGKISYPYKHQYFPSLKIWSGDIAPTTSLTAKNQSYSDSSSEWAEDDADTWLANNRYETVYEQVLMQQNGYKITLLALGEEKDGEREGLQKSWTPGFHR